jgi:hypothetical protein
MSNSSMVEEASTVGSMSLDLSLLSNEYETEIDVAGDLEIFVQLANVGHFDRATQYFRTHLAASAYRASFPIVAEYAEALIDQGDFGKADDFLSHVSVAGSKEKDALSLMHALVRMHTNIECADALELAKAMLQNREIHPLASLDILDVSTLQTKAITILGLMLVDANCNPVSSYRRRKSKSAVVSIRDPRIPGSSFLDVDPRQRTAGEIRVHNRDIMRKTEVLGGSSIAGHLRAQSSLFCVD